MAAIPTELKKDPAAFAQIKLLNAAVNGLEEEQAARIAQHIKLFGIAIQRAEIEAGLYTRNENGERVVYTEECDGPPNPRERKEV